MDILILSLAKKINNPKTNNLGNSNDPQTLDDSISILSRNICSGNSNISVTYDEGTISPTTEPYNTTTIKTYEPSTCNNNDKNTVTCNLEKSSDDTEYLCYSHTYYEQSFSKYPTIQNYWYVIN